MSIDVILSEARGSRKRDFASYSALKNKLAELDLKPKEYESVIRELARILQV